MVTFRTVENLVAGDGFTWNTAERTQTATHPLWILVLSAFRFVTGELYLTAITVSLFCTTLAAWLIARHALSTAAAIVIVPIAMLSSRTAMEYATGGLENPLVYLLIACFAGAWFGAGADAGADANPQRGRRLRDLGLLATLLVLARIDLVLLVAPCLLAAMRGMRPGRIALALLPGALLFFGWCAFATLYFGTVIPTPGYAKALALDLPFGALAAQGCLYLLDLCWRDPATALLLLAALGLGLKSKNALFVAPALGILLQIVYTLKIGGDFMAGRFFSAALMFAIAALSRLLEWRGAIVLGGGLLLCAAFAPGWPPWLDLVPPQSAAQPSHGITDERNYYAQSLAMWSDDRDWPEYGSFTARLFPDRTRPMVALRHAVGHDSLKAGPLVHIVEPWICDPLLVRLPLANRQHWRIGHFTRRIPEGYLETLASGENRLHHPALREYYDALSTVLRAPVFDSERLATLGRYLAGEFDGLLLQYVQEEYYEPPLITVPAARLSQPVEPGTFWFDSDGIVVREGGLRVQFKAPVQASSIVLTADGSGSGELRFCRGDTVLASTPFAVTTFGAVEQVLAMPGEARGFEALELYPVLTGDPSVAPDPCRSGTTFVQPAHARGNQPGGRRPH